MAEPLLPELNDDLAKKLGVEDGFDAFQDKVINEPLMTGEFNVSDCGSYPSLLTNFSTK